MSPPSNAKRPPVPSTIATSLPGAWIPTYMDYLGPSPIPYQDCYRGSRIVSQQDYRGIHNQHFHLVPELS